MSGAMAFCSVTLRLSVDQFDIVLYRSSQVLFRAVLWCLVMARQGMVVFSKVTARFGVVQYCFVANCDGKVQYGALWLSNVKAVCNEVR